MWKFIGPTIAAVTLARSACAHPPAHPPPVIRDKIDRDAHLDGTCLS